MQINRLAETVAEACADAACRVTKISNGFTIHDLGLEAFITCHVANLIFEKFGIGKGRNIIVYPELLLGDLYDDIHKNCGGKRNPKKRGRHPRGAGLQARVDLAFYKSKVPYCVLEAKRRANPSAFRGDIEKIRHILSRGSYSIRPLKYGIICGVAEINARNKEKGFNKTKFHVKIPKYKNIRFDIFNKKIILEKPNSFETVDGKKGIIFGYTGVVILMTWVE